MAIGRLGRVAFIIGLVASAGAAGCFLGEEETGAEGDRVTAGGSLGDVLKSTLVLDSGCMATKVGPRHLLTAARCVAGKSAFAAGKTITFKPATQLSSITRDDAAAPDEDETVADDAGAADAGALDAGSSNGGADAGGTDGDASSKSNRSAREAKIEKVEINASYTAKCSAAASCSFNSLGASDAKDIAVIILDADLDAVPTVPIDLDAVGQSDKVLVVGSDCGKFEGQPTGVTTFETIAIPAKAVNHDGSPYAQEPELVTRLSAGYVVTPGAGWRDGEPRICKDDIGAPLFRGDKAAVAGVMSNFTMFVGGKAPVTLHHTKVDVTSKVGTWLKSLGVSTTRSCSEATGGCVKKSYDGGLPKGSSASNTGGGTEPGDGGELIPPPDGGEAEEDAGPVNTDLPEQGEEEPLPDSTGDDDFGPSGGDDYSDYDAGRRKKKKKQTSGCSAAPGSMPSGSDGMVFVLGIALAGAMARRRRSS
jgi:MYXO-CTERM domain-containing protein